MQRPILLVFKGGNKKGKKDTHCNSYIKLDLVAQFITQCDG